jgi:hypothetical protein
MRPGGGGIHVPYVPDDVVGAAAATEGSAAPRGRSVEADAASVCWRSLHWDAGT